MLSILSGTALTLTDSLPVPIGDRTLGKIMANGTLLGLPAAVWWTVVFALAGIYVLHLSGHRPAHGGDRRQRGGGALLGH